MRLFRQLPLAVALVLAPVRAIADDLFFLLHNDSSYVIVELYASPSDVGSWEDDILGPDVLGSGETARVRIADGREQCEYDLRIVFSDGDVLEDTTDLCDTGSYTVSD